MNRWRAFFKTVIVLIVLVGIGSSLSKAWREFERQKKDLSTELEMLDANLATAEGDAHRELEAKIATLQSHRRGILRFNFPSFVASVFLCMLGMLPPGLFWHRTLKGLGYPLPKLPTFAAYFLGHLGKYVPGKAMVVVLRVGRLRRMGVPTSTAMISIFVETLVLMAVGGALGGICIALSDAPIWMIAGAWCMVLATALPTLPPVFRRVVGFLAKKRRLGVQESDLNGLSWRLLGEGWCWNVVGWLLMSLSLWTILLGMLPEKQNELMSHPAIIACIASATLSVVAGFVSFLPGGAGVREMVIITLLAPWIGSAPAIIAAVWMRLASLSAEGICAGLAVWFARNHPLPTQSTTAIHVSE